MDMDQVYLYPYLYLNFYGNEGEIQEVGEETDISSICED
jgi:hypothetical protein